MVDISLPNLITVGALAAIFIALLKLFTQMTGIAIPFITA